MVRSPAVTGARGRLLRLLLEIRQVRQLKTLGQQRTHRKLQSRQRKWKPLRKTRFILRQDSEPWGLLLQEHRVERPPLVKLH